MIQICGVQSKPKKGGQDMTDAQKSAVFEQYHEKAHSNFRYQWHIESRLASFPWRLVRFRFSTHFGITILAKAPLGERKLELGKETIFASLNIKICLGYAMFNIMIDAGPFNPQIIRCPDPWNSFQKLALNSRICIQSIHVLTRL